MNNQNQRPEDEIQNIEQFQVKRGESEDLDDDDVEEVDVEEDIEDEQAEVDEDVDDIGGDLAGNASGNEADFPIDDDDEEED